MYKITNYVGNDTLIFADTFEDTARKQVETLCNFAPYQHEKIRIMPDVHAGSGCTIGTTMTIHDTITPNMVGVDIGCGMDVTLIGKKAIDFKELDAFIRNNIPSGFNIRQKPVGCVDIDGLICLNYIKHDRADLSLGTLGGGNHFIEVAKDSKDNRWLIVHSGSRNLGLQVCNYYQKMAQKSHPECDKSIAYLDGVDARDYLHDMSIIQDYASVNRMTMSTIISEYLDGDAFSQFETIHNYIDFSRMILRKGAVSAEHGEKLIIPMNMRDGSLLCVGKGNEDWNYSAPHGAGRILSRTKAKETLSMDTFNLSMEGIYTTSVSKDTLDESPMAYKPISEIMSLIGDTVDVIDILTPVYNFKAS
jgi:RNA-splicing ligase RtcB